MSRYRERWALHKRRSSKHSIWYYRAYDEYGQRTPGRSTGKTSRTLAELEQR